MQFISDSMELSTELVFFQNKKEKASDQNYQKKKKQRHKMTLGTGTFLTFWETWLRSNSVWHTLLLAFFNSNLRSAIIFRQSSSLVYSNKKNQKTKNNPHSGFWNLNKDQQWHLAGGNSQHCKSSYTEYLSKSQNQLRNYFAISKLKTGQNSQHPF